ncbi:polysaccharide deacetylase family protein [Nocardia sp. NPDC052566]|uniref:polysaccharide deacetylase family protein n=1 Tax=Nocardia sp. NPDC052566 TaxID=3364330 RepID=UPI0037C61B71
MARTAVIGIRIVAAAALFLAAACAAQRDPAHVETSAPPPPPAPSPAPDPAAVAANELGLVPILMYHQIVAAPSGEYDQTPEEFRAELDRLHREGYRPVTAADYISGAIDLPAGAHPVVLTFDDSTVSQLSFTDDGKPLPDTAIGILEAFAAAHPGFAPRATFYVNNEPFGNDPRALPWLAAHGYEIGAHTASHANLARLDSTGVQRELAENVSAIESGAPGARVRTMALPLGVAPADRALASAGEWQGRRYRFDAVMLVGAEPAPSPYGQVDPTGVPRIRSARGEVDFDSAYWLDRLAADPGLRYTADGDPARISFPRALAERLGGPWSNRAAPY